MQKSHYLSIKTTELNKKSQARQKNNVCVSEHDANNSSNLLLKSRRTKWNNYNVKDSTLQQVPTS